ncbi:hypothetical protein ARTHRO9V_230064 [Arthrobacter sp. 9V]|nr:hypothetical protein ARTHRO9V_230064 [Arthrobacter sp. 9V]
MPWVASPWAFLSEQQTWAFLPERRIHPAVTAATPLNKNATAWQRMAIGCQWRAKMAKLEGQDPPVNCVTAPPERNRTTKEIS